MLDASSTAPVVASVIDGEASKTFGAAKASTPLLIVVVPV